MSISSPAEKDAQESSPASSRRHEVDHQDDHGEDGEVSESTTSSKSTTPDAQDAKLTLTNAPLPTNEEPPPLPNEAPPGEPVDDGWEPIWDDRAQAFYFFNRFTKVSQWENPRVSDATQQVGPPGVGNYDRLAGVGPTDAAPVKKAGGYDPAIHGDYDPNADYAKMYEISSQTDAVGPATGPDPSDAYAATGAFNRFTGKWQRADLNPDNFSDEQKSRRQMNAFFDVDAAANVHDGRSLRAERANKKLSKAELKAFKEKRREKKEEKRRAWLRD